MVRVGRARKYYILKVTRFLTTTAWCPARQVSPPCAPLYGLHEDWDLWAEANNLRRGEVDNPRSPHSANSSIRDTDNRGSSVSPDRNTASAGSIAIPAPAPAAPAAPSDGGVNSTAAQPPGKYHHAVCLQADGDVCLQANQQDASTPPSGRAGGEAGAKTGGNVQGDSPEGGGRRRDVRRRGVGGDGLCLLMKSVEPECARYRGVSGPVLTLQAIGDSAFCVLCAMRCRVVSAPQPCPLLRA